MALGKLTLLLVLALFSRRSSAADTSDVCAVVNTIDPYFTDDLCSCTANSCSTGLAAGCQKNFDIAGNEMGAGLKFDLQPCGGCPSGDQAYVALSYKVGTATDYTELGRAELGVEYTLNHRYTEAIPGAGISYSGNEIGLFLTVTESGTALHRKVMSKTRLVVEVLSKVQVATDVYFNSSSDKSSLDIG